MKTEILQGVAAFGFAAGALANGGLAIHHHSEAVSADIRATVYGEQGDYRAAQRFEDRADDERALRNIYGGITGGHIAAAGIFVYLAIPTRREREG